MVSYDHPVTWKKLLFQQKKSQISEYGWFFKCTMSLLKMEYKGANYTLIRQLPVYTQDGFSKQYSKLTNKYWESVCTKKKKAPRVILLIS